MIIKIPPSSAVWSNQYGIAQNSPTAVLREVGKRGCGKQWQRQGQLH